MQHISVCRAQIPELLRMRVVFATVEESEIAVRISTRDLQFAVHSAHCICSGEYLCCSKYEEDPFRGVRFEFLLVC